MREAVVAFVRKRYLQSHDNLFTLVDDLPEEEWSWRPTPVAHNIAFQVWHSARFFDYVQARLAGLTPGLVRPVGPARQIWR